MNITRDNLHPQLTCDACQRQIESRNDDDDYLFLNPLPRPASERGTVTDMAFVPDLDRGHHFCGLRCLCQWAAAQRSPFTGKPW